MQFIIFWNEIFVYWLIVIAHNMLCCDCTVLIRLVVLSHVDEQRNYPPSGYWAVIVSKVSIKGIGKLIRDSKKQAHL